MGALMRAHDRTATRLGPPEAWPRSLKTAIRIMLTSRQPIWIGWGAELMFFYNDPYRSIVGGKHPQALGRPTAVVWQEIWTEIGPMLATAMTGAEGTYVEEQLLIMERNGYPEETYYTFSYSPIPDDDGAAGGIICANTEDTRRVIGERQISLLRELASGSADARTWRDACRRALDAFRADPRDLPFAMLYVGAADGRELAFAGSHGIAPGHPAAPVELPADAPAWPFAEALATHRPQLVDGLRARFPGLPAGAWTLPPDRAAVIPVPLPREAGRVAVLVVGLNPFRLFDSAYAGFLELVAGQIAAAIGAAEAYEQERRRAEVLAELDRAKTAFFANVSHEFRTPLTLMLGPLEELRDSPGVDAPARALVEVTHRNGLRLLKLVNALLDFSRIEAGRVRLNRQPTDLAAFTAELASTFRSAIEKAGLDFTVDCPVLPAPARIDREMWEKVVLNLLSNAFKFTLSGSIAVRLAAAPEGSAAVLTVADTGIGIPAGEVPHLFERFHRVEGAQGRTIEGSGIGLALVQELVRLHDGGVAVASAPGAGTTFTVTLPLDQAAAGTPALPATPSAHNRAFVEEAERWVAEDGATPEPALPQDAGAMAADGRILVADDNADLRDYIRRLLAAEGYPVETAPDGAAALAAARREPPGLVLSDIMMPVLDGLGLLAALRDDPALRDIPVLLLSAQAGEEARVLGLRAGADDYLTKPFSGRELLARVAGALKLARLRRESSARLSAEAATLEALNRVGAEIAAELDLPRMVQVVTDAATRLTGAAFGAFFYNAEGPDGEGYRLYAISGAPRAAFEGFPMPRNTAIFAPTFAGTQVVRADDITADPRYGRNAPHRGMPAGHLPVRSYLAAPVISRTGEVLGGLFFGHPEPGRFCDRSERIATGIAVQAAGAIDNARLYQAAQEEAGRRGKAEAALRELNETLARRIVEAVAERDRLWDLSEDLLGVADYDGRLLRVSPSWQRVLGHDLATLLAQSYVGLVHADDYQHAMQVIRGMRASGRPAQVETRVRTAGGGWRHIAWTLSPEPGTARLHGVGRDVTEERERATALHQAEEALRVAQKMEAVGNLTGGVAHDFNNLLQVIGGNLQLLSKDLAGQHMPGQARAEQRLRNALSGVARGSRLAAQLLAFGRRQPLAPKVVNLGRFVRGLDDMLRRALGDGIEIETIVSGGLWNTLADPFQVENALLNLAINARDAMGGHGRLTIEAGNAVLDDTYALRHADVTPGQYVMLAVTDTGVGMTPDLLERVFEPFFTTKAEGQGTGLGLSMVYGFVKQSDGHVKIYSEPGQGTTVRLYLPRSQQEEDIETEIDTGPVTGGSETVLVVEDDEDVRGTVVEMLQDLGYRVLKAKNAHSALAIVESGVAVDLLFTDVVMPGPLRSPELARKARERLPNIAVLFTSGYTENAIVHGGRLDAGIELLSKPYTREALARRLRHVLRNQEQRAVAREAAAAPPVQERLLRVVLVEDDALIRMATADMLAELGHEVREAATAAEAQQALASGPADVLLADISLPDMSGVALAADAVRRWPDLRVIFASGHADVPGLERYPELARAERLPKPYDAAELARALAGR